MSWLDPLLALKTQQAGTTAGTRQTINFASGATVVDDPANDRVNVTIAGGLPGVTVTGTPTAGQTVVASSASAAAWGSVPRGNVTNTSGAAGDLITGNATTLTRLGIGSTGQVLTVSGGAPAWSNPGQSVRTTYELDFGTVAAETVLSGAGTTTRTYNGVTWTYTNTTTGGAVSQVTSAAGLTQTAAPWSSPTIDATFTGLGAYNVLAGNWRAWVYFDVFTPNSNPNGDNFMDLLCRSGATELSICRRGSSPAVFGPNFYAVNGPNISGAFVNAYQSGFTQYNILITECVGGNFINRMGLYSNGDWTNLGTCRVMSVGSPSDATLATAGAGISVSGATIQIRTNISNGATVANRIKLFKFEVW